MFNVAFQAFELKPKQFEPYENDGYLSPVNFFNEEEASPFRKLLEEAAGKFVPKRWW